LLEKFVAHLILDVGDKLEKIRHVYLLISQNVPERVCQGCLELQQRFEGYFVDLFETVPVDI
jgi:hypothetical protein